VSDTFIDARAAWRAWRSYRGADAATRAFLAARIAVAPLGPMGPELRSLRGRVLSVGCGHGIVERYLAEVNPEVQMDGIELDEERVRVAQATEEASPRVRVRVADVTRLDIEEPYDAALAVDVLHHVPFEHHASIARALLHILEPGGLLLVKDISTTPRPQYLWNRLHDLLVTGPGPSWCRSPGELARLLEEAGMKVESWRRMRRIQLYPHYLVVARRPT
jgi:2-polyprenyl-3-methyl-5-hydroxy-6-metoxy-1,4-benzoquinol methylase